MPYTYILYLKKYKALKLDDIYYFCMAILMYRVAHSDVPYNIYKMFCLVSSVHKYSTRQSSNYYINSSRTKLKSETFKISGPKIWNEIDNLAKTKKNIHTFKRHLKKSILNNY